MTTEEYFEIIVEDEDAPVSVTVLNRGTGAGGANTNINGLSYEDKTDLKSLYSSCDINKKDNYKTIRFTGYDGIELINANKSALHKYMLKINEKNTSILPAAGCKEPDEAYVNDTHKIIFIIEKKFQQGPGSVDEKIQTGPFKKLHYGKLFPNYKIYYIYCLSDWFKRPEYASVLDYLTECSIQIFWGNDDDYKNKMVEFICSQN